MTVTSYAVKQAGQTIRCLWPVTNLFQLGIQWFDEVVSYACELIILFLGVLYLAGAAHKFGFTLSSTEHLTHGNQWKETGSRTPTDKTSLTQNCSGKSTIVASVEFLSSCVSLKLSLAYIAANSSGLHSSIPADCHFQNWHNIIQNVLILWHDGLYKWEVRTSTTFRSCVMWRHSCSCVCHGGILEKGVMTSVISLHWHKWRWMVSFTPCQIYPCGKIIKYLCHMLENKDIKS
jgi:hypothetical protein